MGCIKSKRSDSAAHNSTEKGKGRKGEKVYLVNSGMGAEDGRPPVNPVLLDYAQRLSEEIVARAVQQWVEVDRRYIDIPYIECDVPWRQRAMLRHFKSKMDKRSIILPIDFGGNFKIANCKCSLMAAWIIFNPEIYNNRREIIVAEAELTNARLLLGFYWIFQFQCWTQRQMFKLKWY